MRGFRHKWFPRHLAVSASPTSPSPAAIIASSASWSSVVIARSVAVTVMVVGVLWRAVVSAERELGFGVAGIGVTGERAGAGGRRRRRR